MSVTLSSSAQPVSAKELPSKAAVTSLRHQLLLLMMLGDILFAYAGLGMGYWLRFKSPLSEIGVIVGGTKAFSDYQLVILLGVFFLLVSYFHQKLYNWKLLLRPRKLLPLTFKATSFWFIIYLCTSVVLKFEPQISRIFMFYSWLSVMTTVGLWKWFFTKIIRTAGFTEQLAQRVLFVGWTQESADLADSIYGDESHPYRITGWIDTPSDTEISSQSAPAIYPKLGQIEDLENIVLEERPDILVVADLNLDRTALATIAKMCELYYIQLKILPSMFQIFISGLHLETISGKPLLGIEEMRIQQVTSQIIKRVTDIIGATIGLILSTPVIAFLAWRICREDPGPIFFRQERIGINHQPFTMLKLRSMKLGSDKHDHLNQSTLRQDPRVLRIGNLMRKLNLDELPQFWNVLMGDMSLVGPRPERTYHANQLSIKIQHYNQRHQVKPGITGWAQIHGLRGNTDLSERVRYDCYYIENWSIWMDFYCLVMTFFKRDNAY